MPHPRHSIYKGFYITTRSAEVVQLSGSALNRFDAFFRVDPADPSEDSWQQFPGATFDTRSDAAANALRAAKRSIDISISAEKLGPGIQIVEGIDPFSREKH